MLGLLAALGTGAMQVGWAGEHLGSANVSTSLVVTVLFQAAFGALGNQAALTAAQREALLPLIHDRMTETVLESLDDAARLFAQVEPQPLKTVDLLGGGIEALQDPVVTESGLAQIKAISQAAVNDMSVSVARAQTRAGEPAQALATLQRICA